MDADFCIPLAYVMSGTKQSLCMILEHSSFWGPKQKKHDKKYEILAF